MWPLTSSPVLWPFMTTFTLSKAELSSHKTLDFLCNCKFGSCLKMKDILFWNPVAVHAEQHYLSGPYHNWTEWVKWMALTSAMPRLPKWLYLLLIIGVIVDLKRRCNPFILGPLIRIKYPTPPNKKWYFTKMCSNSNLSSPTKTQLVHLSAWRQLIYACCRLHMLPLWQLQWMNITCLWRVINIYEYMLSKWNCKCFVQYVLSNKLHLVNQSVDSLGGFSYLILCNTHSQKNWLPVHLAVFL